MTVYTPEHTQTFESLGIKPDHFKNIPTSINRAILPRFAEMNDNGVNHLKSEQEMVAWYENNKDEFDQFLIGNQLDAEFISLFPYMIYVGDLGKTGGFSDIGGRKIIGKLYSYLFSAKHQEALNKGFPYANSEGSSPKFNQLPIVRAVYLHYKLSGESEDQYDIPNDEINYLMHLGFSPTKTTMQQFWSEAHIRCNEQLQELADMKACPTAYKATELGSSHHFTQNVFPDSLRKSLDTNPNYIAENKGYFTVIALLEIMDKIEAFMHRDGNSPNSFSDAYNIVKNIVPTTLKSNFEDKPYYKELEEIYIQAFEFLKTHPPL